AIGLLRTQTADFGRLSLVINRHHRRYHHGRAEIEWTLGVPVAAVVPDDPESARRALSAQRPLVSLQRSRAGRAVQDLAASLDRGDILTSRGQPGGSST